MEEPTYDDLKQNENIYETCIRPILTYVAETRAKIFKTKRILRITEMRTLRAIQKVSLKDRITND
jgi:hypothetical protein